MKPELENLKEYTKNTSLTKEEKFDMFQNIRAYSNANPIKSSYYSIFFKHSIAYASMIAIIIGTSATSFAAERALPGDILYPIKTEINEGIAKTLSITKTQKAKTNVKLVDKRMEELTKIVAIEEDTPDKIEIIVEQLEENKKQIQKYIEEVETNNPEESDDALAIYTELESVIETHLTVLEDITEEENIDVSIMNEIAETSDITVTATKLTIEETPQEENKLSTSTKDIDKDKEQNAMSEMIDFSEDLEPILIEAKAKINHKADEATSTKIKDDTRKRIIEKAEEELHIDVEETE